MHCLVALKQHVANYKCYIKGTGDRVSGNRRSISTIIYSLLSELDTDKELNCS